MMDPTLSGLILDMFGALLIAAPYYPYQVRRIIYSAFPYGRRLENVRKKMGTSDGLSIESEENELEILYELLDESYELDRKISNNSHIREDHTIHGITISLDTIGVTFENEEGHGFVEQNPLITLNRTIDRELERYFVKYGAISLVFGFMLQIVGVYYP